MDKMIITGATGMLGSYAINALNPKRNHIIIAGRDTIDLTKPEAIFAYIKQISPDKIIHLAAQTNVELCEQDRKLAETCNHLATEQIAKAAAECNSWLLYISSSAVFGKELKFTYNELDTPSPVNYYGVVKLKAEISIRKYCPNNYLIIRPSWMIGGGNKDHKFVGKIVRQINNGNKLIRAVYDKHGNITYAYKLGKFIAWAADNKLTGTFHYASHGTISRYDIAKKICDLMKYKGEIIPVDSSSFPALAPRAPSEGIESIYLDKVLNAPSSGYWKNDLAEYINDIL